MKMLYISHPYTGDEEKNCAEAYFIVARLARKFPDVAFLNPLDAMRYAVAAKLDYDTVLSQCISILRRCDGIIMTGSWQESEGCRKEHKAAVTAGIRVYDGVEEFLEKVGQ